MWSCKATVVSDNDVLICQLLQGERLRVEFEKNKGIVSFVNTALVCKSASLQSFISWQTSQANTNQVERILARGEAKLREYAHPDPYIGKAG